MTKLAIAEDDGGQFDFIIRRSDKFCTIFDRYLIFFVKPPTRFVVFFLGLSLVFHISNSCGLDFGTLFQNSRISGLALETQSGSITQYTLLKIEY
jgi:hypothetical protein